MPALVASMFTMAAEAAPADLFFSEYVEGSSNNKALEIYNGTAAPIDLSVGQYKVQIYVNGASTGQTAINLSGTIAAGATFVIANNSASTAVTSVANQLSSSLTYNGNDAVVLLKGGATKVDVIGQIGFDPGAAGWGVDPTNTTDNTIRRKSTVCAGDPDGTNVFDPAIEWDGFAVDTFSGLGSHTTNCSPTNPSVTGTASPNSVLPGGTTHLSATVRPGTNPTSTDVAVNVDLTSINGAANTPLFDDGMHNDGAAGDNVFGLDLTVDAGATPGAKSLALTVTDGEMRSGSGTSIALTILQQTSPSFSAASATPGTVTAGGSAHLSATVTPGTNPSSSGLAVTVDTSAVGGAAGTPMFDDGAHNDGAAGDNVFGLDITVGGATPAASYSLPIAVSDAQARSGMGSIALDVTAGATPPSVSGTATPASVAVTDTTHLKALVIPGANPPSTALTVSADLSSINGGSVSLFDDGAHGDGAAGDNEFGLDVTIDAAATPGSKSLPLSVSDGESRSGSGSIALTVLTPTSPTVSAASAAPASVPAGNTTHLAVTVAPGTNPASSSLAVTVDTSAIGGAAGTSLFDDGAHGDGAAGDNVFGLDVTVSSGTATGSKSLPVSVSDSLSRTASGTITLGVTAAPLRIGQIQGNGLASPYAGNGQIYTTVGNVVTAKKSNGFVIQDPVGDGNPDTSDGIIVFTGTNSNPAVNVGDVVTVTGKIVEFSGTTEFSGSVTYQVTGTATPIAPIVLDNSLPSPNPTIGFCHGTLPANSPGAANWECLESMLVSMNGVVTGGTNGGAAADATHPGTPSFFFATVDTQPRPFRETGIAYPGVGGLPVWDGDPELIEFFPSQGYPPAPTQIVVNAGQTFSSTAIVGAYQSGTAPEIYELYPVTFTPTGSAPVTVKPVADAAAGTLTVASQNMLHLFNDVADSGSADQCTTQGSKDVCPTTAQFTIRKQKLSLQVRTVLKAPAVIGVQEVENRASLQALADQIHSDDPSLTYTPYLIEGNDVGGIDVGFLVRSDVVVSQVTQIGKGTQTNNCSGTPPCLLNDRPPLLLEGTFNGQRFAVLNIHNRSLSGLGDPTRAYIGPKRLEQAQQVAGIVQGWQTGATQVGVGNAQQDASGTVTTGSFNVVGDTDVPIVVVGDYNAYEFTDGYVDVVGQIKGTAVQADNMYWAAPVTTPTLCDAGLTTDPATRYSFMFDGYVQELDHALVSRRGWRDFVRLDNAHGNADTSEAGPEVTNPATAARSADHDGQVLVLAVDRFFSDGFDSDSCR